MYSEYAGTLLFPCKTTVHTPHLWKTSSDLIRKHQDMCHRVYNKNTVGDLLSIYASFVTYKYCTLCIFAE